MHIRQHIEELISNSPSYLSYRKIIRDAYPEVDSELSHGPYSRYAENLYLFLKEMSSRPLCSRCETELKYINRSGGYGNFCSTKCSAASTDTIEKRRSTNATKTDDEKNLIINRRKKTMMDRHGCEHALQNKEILCKAVNKINGLDHANVTKKRKKTIKERYNVETVWDIPGFREKIRETNLARYGTEWALQNQNVINKRRQTANYEFYSSLATRVPNATPLFTIEEFLGVRHQYQWLCSKCNTEYQDHFDDGKDPVCPTCWPTGHGTSKEEQELVTWLQDINVKNIVQRDKTLIGPKEIDIWLPDYRLAIEYNGLYWHSELKISDNRYHQRKFVECEKLGIQLVQIFADEWVLKPAIVKNRLRHLLGMSITTAMARKCQIQIIPKMQYDRFLEDTHIQGTCVSKTRLGAFFQGSLVAVMGFGKNRSIVRSTSWELLRFACIGNIPGIASKMFSHFVESEKPIEVISFCDLRWGTGNVYRSMGMTESHISSPGYWYSRDGINRYHRSNFTKKSLVADGHDPELTESVIMKSKGYYKIWDAGHRKFTWKP